MGRPIHPKLPIARTVGENIRHLRKLRGMTLGALSERTTTAGHHVDRAALGDIERNYTARGVPKAVTVDQLHAVAAVLGVDPETLLRAPDCAACRDTPPPGMTCNACGAGQPSGLPVLACRKAKDHAPHLWLHEGRAYECTGTRDGSASASGPQNSRETAQNRP